MHLVIDIFWSLKNISLVLTGSVLFYGFLTLLIGVVFRLVSGYLSFCGGNMNWKEKAYITLSGFPKATGMIET